MAASINDNRRRPEIIRDEYSEPSQDGAFCKYSWLCSAVDYFAKHSTLGVLQGKCASDKAKQKLGALPFV